MILQEECFIVPAGEQPTRRAGKSRMHYKLTETGLIRLKEECQRLEHSVTIAKSAGLLNHDEPPLDIQRLLLGQ